MKVLTTGFSGLVGSEISKILLRSKRYVDHTFIDVKRSPNATYLGIAAKTLSSSTFFGDCTDSHFLEDTLSRVRPDLVIHLAQMKIVPSILEALNNTSCSPRLLILGTTAVHSAYPSCSAEYCAAEEALVSSQYRFKVIRSSLIYGSKHDKNFHKLFYAISNKLPILLPAAGNGLYQPIYYADLARILSEEIFSDYDRSFRNCFGPESITLKSIINKISVLSQSSPIVIPVNQTLAFNTLSLLQRIGISNCLNLPVTSEQVLRLTEDKCSSEAISNDFFSKDLTSIDVGLHKEYLDITF